MAVMLRILLVLKWRSLTKANGDLKFDAKYHPGLSMVRTVMYLFLLFVVIWNVNATSHIFGIDPDTQNDASPGYCHPAAYWYKCKANKALFLS